jgi:hypothetical protein
MKLFKRPWLLSFSLIFAASYWGATQTMAAGPGPKPTPPQSRLDFAPYEQYNRAASGAIEQQKMPPGASQRTAPQPPNVRTAPAGVHPAEHHNSMMAESPFTDYTAGVLIFGLITAFLVSVLLIGGFLILNLGLMSKRAEDRVGSRDPSDVDILSNISWPQVAYIKKVLPAEDVDVLERQDQAPSKPQNDGDGQGKLAS